MINQTKEREINHKNISTQLAFRKKSLKFVTMGRVQYAFNCIAIVGAAIHILAGIVAVYYLIPKASVAHEEILSRKSRSLDSVNIIVEEISNSTSQYECKTADTCTQCVALSRECIWYNTNSKAGCFTIETQSIFVIGSTMAVVYQEGADNVSWGSCEVPLAVIFFVTISMAVIVVIVVAFIVVHLICKPSKEEQMLIEVTHAVRKEKFLKRLGRLNPLPSNFQGLGIKV